ncbi:hypothetical protein ES708_16214 [subsurface metagenome]
MAEDEIVVYERGKEATPITKRIPPELLQIIMLDDIQVALTKVNKHLEKAEFKGVVDPRTLSATDKLQALAPLYDWPFTPWIGAYFINDGPDTVRLAINEPLNQFDVRLNETITLDYSHADERIRVVFYVCDTGKTASVRVMGEY